jgi:hypothetical protein
MMAREAKLNTSSRAAFLRRRAFFSAGVVARDLMFCLIKQQ